jgi:multidrug efflux pump subunit AcrA (membrane-fusion protein)
MVKPVQGGEKGDSLFTIVRMDIMRVQVDVPEADAIYIKAGDPARIVIQAQENETVGFRGDINTTVTRISYALDPTARTMRVEMQLDNSKYHLLPEMYAYAYIPIVYKNVWALPESAIVQKEEQGSFIFRNVDGMAVFTPVKLGKRADKEVQLLKYQEKPASPGSKGVWRDFTGGEQVIMNPVGFVDGVKIEQSEPAN